MSVKNTRENESFLTIQALQRMPYYLHCLEEAKAEGTETISATSIANKLPLNDVLVRKDIVRCLTSSFFAISVFRSSQ